MLVECEEAYTFITCAMCREINPTLGRGRVLRCAGCSDRFDCDVNAAKNI